MAHTQLSVEEREEIQLGLWRKESVRSIAKRLDRSHSSIVREISKNLPPGIPTELVQALVILLSMCAVN